MRKIVVAAAAASLLLTLPSPAEAAAKRFTVTLSAPATVYYLFSHDTCEDRGPQGHGEVLVKITGTVSPVRAGKRVTIYKKFPGGSGRVEGTARVRSSGRYTFLDRPTSSRTRYYKAKMPATGSYDKGFSSYQRVRFEGFCDE